MKIALRGEKKREISFDTALLKEGVYPRQQLSELLVKYNQQIGNDAAAIQQAKKLGEEGSICVFTGQQLGMFGGPSYTILKAISCILLARELGAIPIFWLATEDHDIAEIDHTYLLDPLGNLEKHRLSFPHDGRFVEELRFSEKNLEELRRFKKTGIEEKSYSRYMTRYLAELFKGTGLVFVEPRILRPLARGFFEKEIIHADAIQKMLQKTEGPLQFAGGTNLFFKEDGGYRVKIKTGKKELLQLIEKEPERFSTNAAARPVLQNTLFPTVAYVAGPTEEKYHQQLVEYHAFHGVKMPQIVPRLSATMIPAYAATLLESCRLHPWEVIPHHLPQVIPGLDSGMEQLQSEWHQSALKILGEDLSSESIYRLVRHFAGKMQHRVVRSRLKKQGVPSHALHLLHNLLHPHDKSQERVLNWEAFQSTTKENLIHELLRQADWRTENHLYCYLK